MPGQTIRVLAPAAPSMPRGARWAADAAMWFTRRVARPIWHALQSAGQRRAARELLQLAERHEKTNPPLARRLREASRFDTL
jgi:hypothetical protein